MAFGFGFNKQKVLNTAEKFVQQGKLQNAIGEYEKILKADAKDLTVMNTVGDLYARLGQNEKAAEHFKNVGDAYASQGFTVKAIAMYKKLSKLKPSLESVLRLAELYTQQGLFNDARAQYKQVAEEFLRTGELEQAVRIFQKILEMDPENVPMRTKLAEVYLGLGKKSEAWQIFTAAAENLRARGLVSAAVEIVQRMLTIDPGNNHALMLRGKLALESGDVAGATAQLEKVADLDNHPDGLSTLMQCYIQTGRLAEAGTFAVKLLTVHNDSNAMFAYADALITANRFESALQVFQQNSESLLAANPAKVLETLHGVIGHVRGNTDALELLLSVLTKSGESTHLAEVYELLAHAYVQIGELEKAREYYRKLTQLEPQNQLHARNYQQVAGRLGSEAASSLISIEEGVSLVDELEATAPFIEQRRSDDAALAVRAAVTDAELFASYNMPAKALEPLLSVLPKAPDDLRVNQKLAALYTRAGQFSDAALRCRTLEKLYHEAGYPDEATRYGELAAKYEERSAAHSAESFVAPAVESPMDRAAQFGTVIEEKPAADVPAAPSTPAVARPSGLFWHAPTPAAPPASVSARAEVASSTKAVPKAEREIDISDEWEGAFVDDSSTATAASKQEAHTPAAGATQAATSPEAIGETVAEIRFYLTHGMVDQARATLAKLRQMQPAAATLKEVTDEVAAASFAQSGPKAAVVEEISIEEDTEATPLLADTASHKDSFAGSWPSAPTVPPTPVPAARPVATLNDFVSDLESSLGDGFMPAAAPAPQPAPQMASAQTSAKRQAPEARMAAGAAAATSGTHAAAMPPSFPATAPASIPPAFDSRHPAAAPAADLSHSLGLDLADMFGELRQELEDDKSSAVTEDCETHYNLGVAFREMGLLDEAIGELQKVCQAVDRGQAFPQVMQTYTWLAQCFLDKGVPEAAIRWYEKALQIPTLDAEARMALHYEIGCAHEAGQNKPIALKHFLEVYGTNIDYRDVAERIKALKS